MKQMLMYTIVMMINAPYVEFLVFKNSQKGRGPTRLCSSANLIEI